MTTTMCAHEDRNIQCIWCTYKISTTIYYYHTEIWFVLSLSLSFFLFDFFLFRLTSTKMHTKKQCARISMTEFIYSFTHSLKSVCRPHPIRIVQEKKRTSTETEKNDAMKCIKHIFMIRLREAAATTMAATNITSDDRFALRDACNTLIASYNTFERPQAENY